MANKSTKSALLLSSISLILCFAMLLGTTLAWFTDSVTSENNIIKSGTLDVSMYYADGTTDPASTTWNDASQGAIFNYDLWEPGYVDVKHIKIENDGTLALKYQVAIVANGEVSKLADVIDVYFVDPATQVASRSMLADGYKVGTLTEALAGMPASTYGELKAGENAQITLALKMQEEAGNEYQGLAIGTDFKIVLMATQLNSESDSFDINYDEGAVYDDDTTPIASTTTISKDTTIKNPAGTVVLDENLLIDTSGSIWGYQLGKVYLDTAYQFQPTLSKEDAEASEYAKWHADFVVSVDKDIPGESIALAGYYDAWCQYNGDKWVALATEDTIPANTEIRLVEALGDGRLTVNYTELSEYGNDGIGFLCGAYRMSNHPDYANNVLPADTTLTVELRLYEVTGSTTSSTDSETGKYITVGKYKYTFE